MDEPIDLDDLFARVPADRLAAVTWLSRVRDAVDHALDDAMAAASLAGASSRSVAEAAGVAPNTVPNRLAHTQALAGYALDGRVGNEAVVRARYDREVGRPAPTVPEREQPMRFQRRKPTGGRS